MKIRIVNGEGYKFKLLARRQRLLSRLEQLREERDEFLAAERLDVVKRKELEMRKIAATVIRINALLNK